MEKSIIRLLIFFTTSLTLNVLCISIGYSIGSIVGATVGFFIGVVIMLLLGKLYRK